MLPLLGEMVGGLLWLADAPGVQFVGAMLSVGSGVAGLGLFGRALVRAWENNKHMN